MSFVPSRIEEFVKIFNASKHNIRAFEGCLHLELLHDTKDAGTFFTYSYWESEEKLNTYRDSELFYGVWNKTKALFSEKPEAWSVKSIAEL